MFYISGMGTVQSLAGIFDSELLADINRCGTVMEFTEGSVIMDYGKYIRMMPIILSGTLKVYKMDEKGNEILLYYLSALESCSMAYQCCMGNRKSEVKAIAEEDTVLVGIPHERLDEWLVIYPAWRQYIMKSFNDRFTELLKSIETIAFHKLDERLISYLQLKQKHAGSSVIKVSHYLIADELATSRVVISRLLKQLENDGKILLYRNEIKLLSGFKPL